MTNKNPKLYLPRECRKVRRTHYLSTDYDKALKILGGTYLLIAGRKISRGIILQRSIDVLAEHAVSVLRDPAKQKEEADAIDNMLKKGLV